MSCYRNVSPFTLEILIYEDYLEVNAFWNIKYQAWFLFKNTFYANFFLYKTGLKMPICAFKDDFKI